MVSHECSWTSRTCRQIEAQGCGRTACRSSRRHARCLSLADLFFFLFFWFSFWKYCDIVGTYARKSYQRDMPKKGMPIAFPSLHTPPPLAVPRLLRLRASQVFEECTSLLLPASQARSSGRCLARALLTYLIGSQFYRKRLLSLQEPKRALPIAAETHQRIVNFKMSTAI